MEGVCRLIRRLAGPLDLVPIACGSEQAFILLTLCSTMESPKALCNVVKCKLCPEYTVVTANSTLVTRKGERMHDRAGVLRQVRLCVQW